MAEGRTSAIGVSRSQNLNVGINHIPTIQSIIEPASTKVRFTFSLFTKQVR
jgi:hypothetical protein